MELNENLSCSVNKPFVYFINGVWNFSKPKDTKERLLEIYGDDIEENFTPKYLSPFNKNKTYELDFLYNRSEGYVLDFIEVINQKIDEYEGQHDPSVWLNVASLIFSPELRPTRLSTTALASAIDNIYFSAITKGITEPPRNQDIVKGYNEISNRLRQKQKVIIVSHSQGNLFANEIVKKIQEDSALVDYQKYLSVMKLASPTHVSYTNEKNIKYDRDFVVRFFGLPANYYLKPNIIKKVNWSLRDYAFGSTYGHTKTEYTKTPEDFSGHGVIEVYLNDKQLASQTIDGSYDNTPVDFFVYEMNQLALQFPDNCSHEIEVDNSKVEALIAPENENGWFNVQIRIPISGLRTDFLDFEENTKYKIEDISLNLSDYISPIAMSIDDNSYSANFKVYQSSIRFGYFDKDKTEFIPSDYGYLSDENYNQSLTGNLSHKFNDKFPYNGKIDFSKVPICYKEECCGAGYIYDGGKCISCPSGLKNSPTTCENFSYRIDLTNVDYEYWPYPINGEELLFACKFNYEVIRVSPLNNEEKVVETSYSYINIHSENKAATATYTSLEIYGDIITVSKGLGACNTTTCAKIYGEESCP